jgi:hypothetical protein
MTKHLCVISRNFNVSEQYGSDIRINTVINELVKLGYSPCIITPIKCVFSLPHKTNGVCIISFVNAWVIPLLKMRGIPIWLDLVDSRKLTINWQLQSRNFLNLLRALRSFALGPFIRRLDLVSYISERDLLFDGIAGKAIVFSNNYPAITPREDLQKRLVLMGDWRYFPNLLGLKNFLSFVWNKYDFEGKGVGLAVYGKNLPEKFRRILGDKYFGYGSHDDVFTTNSVFISPIEIGSGVKNKTILPILAGCTVVTFQEGASNIESSENLIVVKNFQQMAEVLIDVSYNWPVFKRVSAVKNSVALRSHEKLLSQIFSA